MHKVEFTEKFKELFYKLPKQAQEIARKLLKRLENQLLGTKLSGDLRECYSIHFFGNRYRLIITLKEDVIYAIYIGKRTNHFYKDVLEALKILKK